MQLKEHSRLEVILYHDAANIDRRNNQIPKLVLHSNLLFQHRHHDLQFEKTVLVIFGYVTGHHFLKCILKALVYNH